MVVEKIEIGVRSSVGRRDGCMPVGRRAGELHTAVRRFDAVTHHNLKNVLGTVPSVRRV